MTAMDRPGTVRAEQDGATRVLVMDYPPLNTIVHGIRAGLVRELLAAELDPGTNSVVVIGAGGNFCGGADLEEFGRGTAMAAPSLHGHIIPFIEAMTKPVVAAIEGFALGGGLELALGCHARVASANARVGLPETNFGLIPGAGGTVRLPRAVGAERAARMIVGAEIVAAPELAGTALFDSLCDGDTRAAAIAFAQTMQGPLPRLRDRPVAPFDAEAVRSLETLDRPSRRASNLAVASILRAAATEADTALAGEYADFIGLLMGDESAALRHLFLAERAAQRVPGLPRPAPVQTATIHGSDALADTLRQAAAKAGIAPGSGLSLATDGTGAVNLTAPVPGRRLLEVLRDDTTDPAALAAAMALLRRLRFLPVCTGPTGLVARIRQAGDRSRLAMVNEAARALEDGAALRPGDIDLALVEAGAFPATTGGPLFWAETRGLPLTIADLERAHRATHDAFWTPARWLLARTQP
ncbi:MAG: enoyl-CoA hydratase/isomerase family protein [Pseudooceanicola sp.]|nr:enoyl-CoA hydratase/isomerase family protein [Pseudooceanicola sp.]